jgi:hypothetical protein
VPHTVKVHVQATDGDVTSEPKKGIGDLQVNARDRLIISFITLPTLAKHQIGSGK